MSSNKVRSLKLDRVASKSTLIDAVATALNGQPHLEGFISSTLLGVSIIADPIKKGWLVYIEGLPVHPFKYRCEPTCIWCCGKRPVPEGSVALAWLILTQKN